MSQINLLTSSVMQTSQVSQQQATDKAQQIRHAQELRRNVAARDDEMEHQVENADDLSAIGDGSGNQQQRPKPRHAPQETPGQADQDPPRLDLTA